MSLFASAVPESSKIFPCSLLRITIHAIGYCARAAEFRPISCKQEHCFTPPRPLIATSTSHAYIVIRSITHIRITRGPVLSTGSLEALTPLCDLTSRDTRDLRLAESSKRTSLRTKYSPELAKYRPARTNSLTTSSYSASDCAVLYILDLEPPSFGIFLSACLS